MNATRSVGIVTLALMTLGDGADAQCVRQVLESPSGSAGDSFGADVEVQDGTLFVGAHFTGIGGGSYGACVVYEEVAGTWQLNTVLQPGDGLTYGLFGRAIALDGDRALVGAAFTEVVADSAGAAFVFERGGGTWTQTARLSPAMLEEWDLFGWELTFDQGHALVSAPGDDDGGSNAGAVYVLEEVAGVWVETDKLVAQGVAGAGEFGHALSIGGDRMLVAAPSSALGGVRRGAVVTYERQGSSWVEIGTLPASGVVDESYFGQDVLIHGERAFAAGNTGAGSATIRKVHVFELVGGTGVEDEVLTLPNQLGAGGWETLAAIDDRLLVTDMSAQLGNGGWGAAYLFRRTPAGYVPETELVAPGSYYFGAALAMPSYDRALVASNWSSQLSSVYVFDLPAYSASACRCSNAAPCANEDEIAGCRNSTGHGTRLYTCGGASVAADDLELLARKLPTNQPAVLLAASEALPPGASFPLGDGLLCGAGTIRRFTVETSDPNGELAWGPGLGASGGWSPGESWSFQVWHRDPAGPCGSGNNISSAVRVRFAP